eukprot:7108045-Prymnesium_polylepis.2
MTSLSPEDVDRLAVQRHQAMTCHHWQRAQALPSVTRWRVLLHPHQRVDLATIAWGVGKLVVVLSTDHTPCALRAACMLAIGRHPASGSERSSASQVAID